MLVYTILFNIASTQTNFVKTRVVCKKSYPFYFLINKFKIIESQKRIKGHVVEEARDRERKREEREREEIEKEKRERKRGEREREEREKER